MWTIVSLTAAKFKPLILSLYVFALSYITNFQIFMENKYSLSRPQATAPCTKPDKSIPQLFIQFL
jgi:hypothetical protein